MQQIKPVIDKRIMAAKSLNTVQFQVGTTLEEYDFDSASFPTGFTKGTFIPLGSKHGYSLVFDNPEFLSFIPVELSIARNLASILSSDRRANVSILGSIVGVKEDTLRYSKRKIVIVNVTNMDVGSK